MDYGKDDFLSIKLPPRLPKSPLGQGKGVIMKYSEFWPFYLEQHSKWGTKLFHTLGTLAFAIQLILGIYLGEIALFILMGAVTGYGFAWFSHFFIEKNKPATFKHPFYSFVSDFRMAYEFLRGRID